MPRSNAHGLIKVRVFSDDRERATRSRHAGRQLDAAPIQHIGKLLVLWRPIPPKAKAEREDRCAGPEVVKVLKFSKSGNHRPR
jgi:RNA-binding protein YhbY